MEYQAHHWQPFHQEQNNNSKKFLDYIDKNDYVQDFERITLNSLTGNLNGSTIISNLLMRWEHRIYFFMMKAREQIWKRKKKKLMTIQILLMVSK